MTAQVHVKERRVATLAADDPAHGRAARAYLASLRTPDGVRTMTSALKRVTELCNFHHADGTPGQWWEMPWLLLDFERMTALASMLAHAFPARTGNRYLSGAKSVVRMGFGMGFVDAATWEKIKLVKGVKILDDIDAAAGRALDAGELRALFAHVDKSSSKRKQNGIIAARDAAQLALMYGGGLRCIEVHRLNVGDVGKGEKALIVTGKGLHRRLVPLPKGAVEALTRWRNTLGMRPDDYPLFVATINGSMRLGGRLSRESIGQRLRVIGRRANVAGFTAHDLRRTFGGDMFDSGADVAIIQKVMGHRNPATTTSYDRRPARSRAQAVEQLRVPYVAPVSQLVVLPYVE